MKPFRFSQKSLGDLDAETASTLIVAAVDIALVIDGAGLIRDVAIRNDEFAALLKGYAEWLDKPFLETVSSESRPKVEALLQEATSSREPRWRSVNHATSDGASIPVLYGAVQIAKDGRVLAFGRDLQAISTLQQRLVDAQQSIEQDYARLRDAELRYRLLFQTSSEAVVIVDAARQRVVEANLAARHLLGEDPGLGVGQALADQFDREDTEAVHALLQHVRAVGRPDSVHARLTGGRGDAVVSAMPFRQDGASLFLIRLSSRQAEPVDAPPKLNAKLLKLLENAPDGFVATDPAGHILNANAAFLHMAQLASKEQAVGQPLDRWLGQSSVDLDVLMTNLRQRGSVRLFATQMRGEQDASAQVEASAVSVMNGGQPCFGFAIRDIGARLRVDTIETRLRGVVRTGEPLARPVEQLAELIGRVSLKDLVREATDMIERLYIEAALEMTGDNRASAAEMLGLSRQSLYVKLRRHGLGDLAADGQN